MYDLSVFELQSQYNKQSKKTKIQYSESTQLNVTLPDETEDQSLIITI